jgi:hypothetical protein
MRDASEVRVVEVKGKRREDLEKLEWIWQVLCENYFP